MSLILLYTKSISTHIRPEAIILMYFFYDSEASGSNHYFKREEKSCGNISEITNRNSWAHTPDMRRSRRIRNSFQGIKEHTERKCAA